MNGADLDATIRRRTQPALPACVQYISIVAVAPKVPTSSKEMASLSGFVSLNSR